jgi:hypothetical protein
MRTASVSAVGLGRGPAGEIEVGSLLGELREHALVVLPIEVVNG